MTVLPLGHLSIFLSDGDDDTTPQDDDGGQDHILVWGWWGSCWIYQLQSCAGMNARGNQEWWESDWDNKDRFQVCFFSTTLPVDSLDLEHNRKVEGEGTVQNNLENLSLWAEGWFAEPLMRGWGGKSWDARALQMHRSNTKTGQLLKTEQRFSWSKKILKKVLVCDWMLIKRWRWR